MRLDFPNAFEPFFDQLAQIICGDYRDSMQVASIHGNTVGNAAGSTLDPIIADSYTVLIRKRDWRRDLPPEFAMEIVTPRDGRLTVQSVDDAGAHWRCAATRLERAASND